MIRMSDLTLEELTGGAETLHMTAQAARAVSDGPHDIRMTAAEQRDRLAEAVEHEAARRMRIGGAHGPLERAELRTEARRDALDARTRISELSSALRTAGMEPAATEAASLARSFDQLLHALADPDSRQPVFACKR